MIEQVNLEVLVEEPSAERALRHLLPKIVPHVAFGIRDFRGKDMLLKDLPNRLLGYAPWIDSACTKVVVVVDRDDDDCRTLKRRLRQIAEKAGLRTEATAAGDAQVLLRVMIEELEAWFFGDVPAVRCAYPRVPASLGQQARFRDPDAIAGGTWEALERVLKKRGYHSAGLQKVRAASDIAPHMDVESNSSRSFQVFRDGLRSLVRESGDHAQTH